VDLIYADSNGTELGILLNYYLDLDCGNTNDFEIAVSIDNNVIAHDSRVYIPNTEYGGIVDKVKADTRSSKVFYSGRTWRGILAKKIIKPPVGEAYYTVSGEANAIIEEIIDDADLSGIFTVAEATDITISSYKFNRYTDLLSGLNAMLATVGARLKIRYYDGSVELTAELIEDRSDEIEISQDSKIYFTAKDDRGGVNHLICLGRGELEERQVVDLYVDENGNIGNTQYYFGLDEITDKLDYPNAESSEELTNKGIERLKELANSSSVEVNVEGMDFELGDIVAGRERITGLYVSKPITQKIVRIENGTAKIEYKVG
jgi:hypothetical protein